jgi:hypothetical protein
MNTYKYNEGIEDAECGFPLNRFLKDDSDYRKGYFSIIEPLLDENTEEVE